MQVQKFFVSISLGAFLLSHSTLASEEIVVRTPSGENFVVNVKPDESFFEVVEKINVGLRCTPAERKELFGEATFETPTSNTGYRLDYMLDDLPLFNAPNAKSCKKIVRDYHKPLTSKDRDIIRHIVLATGNKSLAYLLKESKNLEKAGDKIDHVHPFRFLECIFTSEDTKAAMASVKGREWVWRKFKKGLYNSLSEEHDKHNLKIEYVKDFAHNIGIDPALILPAIKHADWDELVTTLIRKVPREGNPTRYNM